MRVERLDRLTNLRESCLVDPFAIRSTPAATRAWAATWTAELTRLGDPQSIQSWTRAATEWDELSRPHDAAYCRWSAARIAIVAGHGTMATRLLRRAAKDAREHAPLTKAIDATVVDARTQKRTHS